MYKMSVYSLGQLALDYIYLSEVITLQVMALCCSTVPYSKTTYIYVITVLSPIGIRAYFCILKNIHVFSSCQYHVQIMFTLSLSSETCHTAVLRGTFFPTFFSFYCHIILSRKIFLLGKQVQHKPKKSFFLVSPVFIHELVKFIHILQACI